MAFASEEDELFLRIANLAPATACGLSRPVTLVFDLGCGNILVRRDEDAMELAGLGVAFGESSRGLGGWSEARLLVKADMDDCEVRRGGGLGRFCFAAGPGEARRSRKESLDATGRDGVASGIGDEDDARLRGLRIGSLEDAGVKEDTERMGGVVVLAYGLGVVSVSGLKLCPVSTSAVFVEAFHLGRLPTTELGRGIPRFAVGVADPSRDGVPTDDILEARGFRLP